MTTTPRRQSEAVTVPLELARPLVRLAVLGARELHQRDGGLALVPGMADLLSALDSSARGTAVARIGQVSSPLTTGRSSGWLTTGEAAEVLSVTARMARKLASRGRLVARRDRHGWLIDRQAAEDYRRQRIA